MPSSFDKVGDVAFVQLDLNDSFITLSSTGVGVECK